MKKVLRIVLKPAVFALFAIVCSFIFTSEVKARVLYISGDDGVESISVTPNKFVYTTGEMITANVVLKNGYMIKSYLNVTNNDPKLNSFSFEYDDGLGQADMVVNVQTEEYEGYDVTFKVQNGSWNDETQQDKIKTIWRKRGENVALLLQAADIPAVGNKPAVGYRVGSWSSPAPVPGDISSNVTYTYTYAPITVSFDANGGSVSPESAAVGSNGKLTSLPTPHRDNYNFAGWFNEAAGETTAVTLNKVYTADTTLVAHWTERPAEYTVTASDDGHGRAVASPTSGATNTRVTVTATPDRDYQFKEWRVISGGVNLDNRRSSQTTFRIGNTNVEVKAIFEKKSKKKDDDDDDDHHEDGSSPAPAKPVNPNAIVGMTYNGNPVGVVKVGPQVQGPAAQAAFKANTPAGWKEAFTFNMTVNDKADYTLKKGILSFKIPSQYLKAGRKFAILGIDNNGKVKVFLDTDTKADTITVNINLEGYAFDLIYYD